MELAFFVFTLVICFFLLYVLCHQDFVLLRQNISLAQILDAAFISLISAFVVGRLFFIASNLDLSLLNIIRFLYFVKFQGISALGFTAGGFIALWFLMRGRKGILRIYDIFSISFIPLYIFNLILRNYPSGAIIFPIITVPLTVVLFIFFLRSHYKYILRDGSISLILGLLVSLDALLYQYLAPDKFILFLDITPSKILSIIFAASCIVLFFLNQRKLKV